MRLPLEVTIRRARPSDKRAILDITRTIWGGNDYVPEVFNAWLKDRRGGLWLALAGERPVGIAKLSLVGDREACLLTLRVAPRWRRRGVARALLAFRLERARRLGARVARLDTADDNVAVHRLMRRFGFRRVDRYGFWSAPARPGTRPRAANVRELAAVRRLVGRAPIFYGEWQRRALNIADIARAIRDHRCLVAGPPGVPRAFAMVESHQERLQVVYLAGRGEALIEVLRLLPAEARRRRRERVSIGASPRHWVALRRAGYRRPWSGSMFLFEKPL